MMGSDTNKRVTKINLKTKENEQHEYMPQALKRYGESDLRVLQVSTP
jgi:hypothetical protein